MYLVFFSRRNAEKVEKLKKQIQEQRERQNEAAEKKVKYQDTLKKLIETLLSFCDKLHVGIFLLYNNTNLNGDETDKSLQEESEVVVADENELSPVEVLDRLNNQINRFIARLGGQPKFDDYLDQILNDKVRNDSVIL